MFSITAALCLIAGVLCSGSEAAENFGAFPHPVWDSEIYVSEQIFPNWVDDNTLLFKGLDKKPQNSQEALTFWPSLYLWRLGERPQPYGVNPIEAAKSYCAEGGWITYRLAEARDPDTGKMVPKVMAGPLGHEVQTIADDASIGRSLVLVTLPSTDSHLTERNKCQSRHDMRMKDRIWVTDADRHFYIDFGAKSELMRADVHLTLMQSDGSDRIELPIMRKDAWPRCTHYHRFLGAFIVWNCLSMGERGSALEDWRRTNCWPAWYVWPPDGRVEKFCLPFGDWSDGGLAQLVPTKVGMYFTVVNFLKSRSLRDPWISGLYQLDDGKAHRVLAGVVRDATVSPSGCKVAFSYAPYTLAERVGTPGTRSLVVVDLCASR